MESLERRIEYYRTAGGHVPYWEWHNSLEDAKTQAVVDVRLARVRAGNFGSCQPVGEGVLELKIITARESEPTSVKSGSAWCFF